jgi:hypothetical protein
VVLVGHPDQDGVEIRVCQHGVVFLVNDTGPMQVSHFRAQIIRQVADGMEFDIARFLDRVEVGDL